MVVVVETYIFTDHMQFLRKSQFQQYQVFNFQTFSEPYKIVLLL